MNTTPSSTQRILWVQVWGLSLVQGAIALTWVIYNLYLVRLLTQFGFSETFAVVLLALENILAAVIEPLMGNFSDRLQHQIGTRFPFIAMGMILSSACFLGIPVVLVFGGPSGGMRWLLPSMMVAWAIAMTLFRSPALSLLGRYAFRTQLPQAASILTLVGGLAGALAPLTGSFILRLGPLFTFFIGSFSLLAAAFALRAAGPNRQIADESQVNVEKRTVKTANAISATPINTVAINRLALIFGTGMGVALGFRLMMQTLPRILSEQIPDTNTNLVLGTVFLSLALTAIPMGKLVTKVGTRLSMAGGLGLMTILTMFMLNSTYPAIAFGIAIAIGTCFSVVSNTTIPFALSMVPAQKAGLGTGLYFSGGAVAMSLYGMAISQGIELSSGLGATLGSAAFLWAAVCVFVSMKTAK